MIFGRQNKRLFSAEELDALESRQPDGITSQEVIAMFQSRGVKLSEATFRKYIQLGLLPTSRRVGRKGKHRGSRGVYPVSVVRRINLIKRLMDQDWTLQEIRDSFVSIQNDIEQLSQAIESLFGHLDGQLQRLKDKGRQVRPLLREVASTRKGAHDLVKNIEKIGSRLAVAGSKAIQNAQGGNP